MNGRGDCGSQRGAGDRMGRGYDGLASDWTLAADHQPGDQGTAGGDQAGEGRVRRKGGGRKSNVSKDPGLSEDLERLVEPVTRGDPESPLRWTSKSVRKLAEELQPRDIRSRMVGERLSRTGVQPAGEPQDEGGGHASGPQCAV